MSTTEQTSNQPSGTQVPGELKIRERARVPEENAGVILTEQAAEKVKQFIAGNGNPEGSYLFVGVKGGGCSGLQYTLDLRDEQRAPVNETDEVFLSHEIPIVVDLKSFIVGNLAGTTIDYQETVMSSGFTFNNPNAKRTCGCGSSYTA